MNSFRIKDLRFRILKGGKIGLAASLMMFGVMFQSTSNAAINDGNSGTGVFVGSQFFDATKGSLVYTGDNTNLTVGNNTDTTVFTNYYTEGGAGSGGGAGLGGVFFVDKGSTLTLNNTIFKFNTVKGGEGGSLPAQVIEDTTLNLSQFSLGLTAFEAQSITPTLTYDNNSGTYSFNTVAVGTGTSLLNNGSSVTFSELTGSNSASITGVTSSAITLGSDITISSSDIKTVSNNVVAQTGFSISGKVVTMDYVNNLAATDTALVQEIKDNLKYNGQISFRNPDGTVEVKTVSNITYDNSGNISSFELNSALSSLTFDPATTSLDIIPITKFETKPYSISGNTITITGATRGFKEGMIIYDENGNSTGVKITSVSSDGKTLTVDNGAALSSVDSITAKETPFLSTTEIKLASPNADLVGASSININGTDYTISSYNNTTGVVTLSSPIDPDVKSQVESYNNPLVIKIPTVSLSGNTITLSNNGQSFNTGMKLDGTNLTITNVTTSNGKIILTLDGSTSSLSTDTKILAVDTLSTGGSMNNLASTGTVGTNGGNGHDANYYASFFNGGEGQAGTRGYAATDGTGAAGGNGGNGGNGSDGLAVNPQLMSELYGATGDFAEAVTALAGSIAPDGAIPTPDYADIAGNVVAVAMASVDLSTAIANTVFWAQNLNNGIAGMGGEGGAGGAGGTGDEFFGGGAGGAGGNGGDGALSFTDGGNGGDGGDGGDAGFGAGGGMGGAGGIAGSTGGAEDGGAGAGGLAGFGGGNGSNGDGLYGDGGSGFGGAIFVRNGGTLNITGNALFEDNMAMAGSSNNGGSAGESAGAAIFMMKGSSVNLMPGYGNVITFNDGIADDSSASYDGASYAPGAGSDIHIQGNGGLVEFNAENTYTGKTIISGATLAADLGVGINNNSRIIFDGTGTSATTSATTYSDSLTLGSTGTLLLDQNLTNRRVGNRTIDVTWLGSGGFASGTTNGIVVNFGQINPGTGQVLTWGTNGFFQGATDKILTFGSEYSLGAVEFQNDVNIGSNTSRIAVYNTNLSNNTNSSTAILSGNWVGNELLIGESDNYDGNLILTGTNQLDKLTILDGTTATSGTGKISDSDTKTVVKMYGGKLVLANNEIFDTVTVNDGALLVSNANLTVEKGITNDGQLVVNTGTFEDNIVNNGEFANGGNITVNADIINASDSLWNQIGTISADNITNNGTWQQQDDITLTSQLINNGTWYSGQQQIIEDVASWVDYEDSVKSTITLATLTGNGTFNINNGDLEINQSGISTFDGDITGQGVFTKTGTGTLRISDAQTFTGGLDVTGGTFETLVGGTLADNLDIHVYEDSTFIAGAVDEVGSVLVDVDGLFTMNANISTQGDFTNNGTLALNANLTTLNTDISTDTDGDFINNGTTTLIADRTITTAGGLVGATTGIINVNNSGTTLTLDQTGDTTYSGKIQGAGNFVKDGEGNLTLNGTVGNIDLDEGTVVNEGTLTTTLANVFAIDQDITVNADGTLHIKEGSQSVDTITNSGTVNLDDDLTLVTLTNNLLATFNQDADITSTDAIMNGDWNVTGDENTDTRVLNTVTLTGNANVTLVSYLNGLTNTASNLKINQSGTSQFDGSIGGNGSVEKTGTGTLRISDAQTFTGGLDVTGGTFETLVGGTLADNLDIHVYEDSTFIAGAVDTVGSVLVDANGTFTMNANTTTQTNFKNDGLVNLNANLTTGTDFENNGTTTLTANRIITTEGGLTGATTGIINVNNTNDELTTLTLAQSGDTTYSGTIKGTGSFVKNGTGNLTLNGVAGSVDLDAGTLVNAGTLTTDSSNVFAQDQNITVSTTGTLHVKTGSQSVTTLTNNGIVNLDDNVTLVTLTNNASGTFNQNANITSTDAIMNGNWNVTGNRVLNTNTLTGDATVTLAEYLKINQTGTSTFDGSISGNGKLEKTGNGTLKISDVQTFLGGLDVTGGTFETLENSRLADTLAINVKQNSTFIAGAVDTVGSVLVDANGTFTMNANTTTQTNFKNDGLVNLNANLTTGTDFENNGTTIALAPRTITTVGGLKGSGDIQTADTLTLAQSGDTTYGGTIKGTGSFVKNGTGNLTLNGVAGSVDLGTQLVINGGILGLDGANILASTLDVLINNNGTMQLINGNQRIDALAGSGLINLGSNKLEVNDGGTFAGTVIGNGTLDIKNGQFTVSSDITSTEGTFNVNDGATTTINQDSNLIFPTVEVQTGGTLNIEGNVQASNNVIVNSDGTLHLTNGGTIDTNLASVYGTLNGIGSITGTTTAYEGSYLRPGNSPGSITFDNLVLDNNSTTVMEIETTQTAGTTFDQIIVNNALTIKNGAKLDLVKFSAGAELAQGEKAKIFDVIPGKISGYFTDVTSTYANNIILNLHTGEVVGLGGTTIAQFENGVTSNENQKKILADLKVNETNGVAQYYGGQIASRLASNQGNSAEIQKIFETFSPEVYSSLLEQNKFALLSSTSKLPTNLENTKTGLSISMDRNTYETDKNSNYMSYNMDSDEIKIDHTGKLYEGFIITSVNAINGDINSTYTEGSTQNYGINVATVQPLGSENLTFRAQASYIKGDSDVSRKTYDSTSYANNIDSSGLIAGLGLGYDKKFEKFNLATTLDVLYYKSQVDGFTENNANVFDALNVLKQDENGVVSKLKVKASKDLTENLSVSGKVEYNKFFDSDKNKVSSNVALENTLMNVENPGIGDDIIGLGIGLDYKVNKEWSAEFNAGISGDKDLTQNNNVGVQIKYAF